MGYRNLANAAEYTPSEQPSLENKIELAEPGSFMEKGVITRLLGNFLEQALREALAANDQGIRGVEQIAPTRDEQISRGREALEQIEGIKPEVWEKLNPKERLEVLQSVENRMAEIQKRPPTKVYAAPMSQSTYGYYNGKSIYINENHLSNNDVAKRVETTIHEGRHAYQHYATIHEGFHPNKEEVSAWRENFKRGNYIEATVNFRRYLQQPVEKDAFQYAADIQQILYK